MNQSTQDTVATLLDFLRSGNKILEEYAPEIAKADEATRRVYEAHKLIDTRLEAILADYNENRINLPGKITVQFSNIQRSYRRLIQASKALTVINEEITALQRLSREVTAYVEAQDM